jgi:hypothetical protein
MVILNVPKKLTEHSSQTVNAQFTADIFGSSVLTIQMAKTSSQEDKMAIDHPVEAEEEAEEVTPF